MRGEEKFTLVAVIGSAVVILVLLSAPPPSGFDLGPLAFWAGLTLISSVVPVRLPGGVRANLSTAPLLAALFDTSLVNPFAICWIAFIGTFELRDFNRQLPWYGGLFQSVQLRPLDLRRVDRPEDHRAVGQGWRPLGDVRPAAHRWLCLRSGQ